MKAFTAGCLFGFLGMCSSGVAAGSLDSGYAPADVRCPTSDDESINTTLLERLDTADMILANIPPEESAYIRAESASLARMFKEETAKGDTIHARSSASYLKLHARPLYYVWMVRKEIEPTRVALKKILIRPSYSGELVDPITYTKNGEAEKLDRAAGAVSQINTYAFALHSYVERQYDSQNPILTSDQVGILYWHSLDMNFWLARFIKCKLAKIMGRQPFP